MEHHEQTQAVTIEFTHYNPMLDYTCATRLILDLGRAGGVLAEHKMYTYRFYKYHRASDTARGSDPSCGHRTTWDLQGPHGNAWGVPHRVPCPGGVLAPQRVPPRPGMEGAPRTWHGLARLAARQRRPGIVWMKLWMAWKSDALLL